jgi:hypothetical protein
LFAWNILYPFLEILFILNHNGSIEVNEFEQLLTPRIYGMDWRGIGKICENLKIKGDIKVALYRAIKYIS